LKQPGGPIAMVGMFIGMFFLVVLAVWGIATSIGLFLLKRWARLSILVFSVLLTIMSAFSALVIPLIPLPPTPDADPRVFAYFRFGMAGFYLMLAAIGVWWFVLFTRRSVKEQFGAYSTPVPLPPGHVPVKRSARPVSITVIAWLMIVGAAFAPLNWFLHPPIPFFWRMLDGWPAALYTGSYAAVAVYVGIGLLKLKPLCRTIAIFLYCFGALNTAVFYLAPGRETRLKAVLSWNPFLPQPYMQFPTAFLLVGAVGGTMLVFVLIYFLVTNKPAFDPPATATPSTA
jgi:hypothetical protein